MYGDLVKEFVIPRREARAFEVYKGQLLKIIEVEGGQCADTDLFNLHNLKEKFGASLTVSVSHHEYRFEKLFSAAPDCNLMCAVVEDTAGVNYCGGRCCWLTYRSHDFYKSIDLENHRNCQDNLAEVIAPYGLTPYDVHDCFVPFMNVVNDSHGRWNIEAPIARKGDYITLRAEMDLLVAISACPGEFSNGGEPKPLGIEIYQGKG